MARTKNLESFFSMMTNVERYVINKGYYLNESGEEVPYSDLAIETFNLLVSLVSSGKYANSDAYKFIGSHFRLSNKDLTSLWNRMFKPSKPKLESTIRVQVSNASKLLYKIFGTNIYETFISDDSDGLNTIKRDCNAILIGNKFFSELFVAEVDLFTSDVSTEQTYSIDDLKSTLHDLKCTSLSNIEAIIDGLDKNKVAYIKDILNQPLFFDDILNRSKVDILCAFFETEIKNQVLVEEILPKTEIEKSDDIVESDSIWGIEGLSFFESVTNDLDSRIENYEGDDLYSENELALAIAILRECCTRTYISQVNTKVSNFLSKGFRNPKVISEVLKLLKNDEDYLDSFIDYCCLDDSDVESRKIVGQTLGKLVERAKKDEDLKKNLVEGR